MKTFLRYKKILATSPLFVLFAPIAARAAAIDTSNLKNFTASIIGIINVSLMPVLASVALVLFVFGVVRYIGAANDSQRRQEGARYMLWGILALFIVFSVWGIIAIFRNSIGIGNPIPQFPE